MWVANRKVIDRYIKRNPAAEPALQRWLRSAASETWLNPHQVLDLHSNARSVGGNRIIFNIRGNRYRLVVHVNFVSKVIRVRFIGTHAQYERIDARRV